MIIKNDDHPSKSWIPIKGIREDLVKYSVKRISWGEQKSRDIIGVVKLLIKKSCIDVKENALNMFYTSC